MLEPNGINYFSFIHEYCCQFEYLRICSDRRPIITCHSKNLPKKPQDSHSYAFQKQFSPGLFFMSSRLFGHNRDVRTGDDLQHQATSVDRSLFSVLLKDCQCRRCAGSALCRGDHAAKPCHSCQSEFLNDSWKNVLAPMRL